MDTKFRIPGLGWRFGLDAIVGLLPGVGDFATAAVSLYVLIVASGYGVPRITLARMALNIAIDYLVGSLPLVGDLFDVWWKANLRNVRLLQRALDAGPRTRRRAAADWLFVAAILLLLTLIVAAAAWLTIAILAFAFEQLRELFT